MEERIQKIISAAGLMSRRAAEKLIAAGGVRVNGTLAALGDKADATRDQITVNGKEFDLLVYLMEHKGQAVRKETLFDAIWGVNCYSEMSSLSVYISWLRDKIEDDPKKPVLIQTVYKVGYRFGDRV